MPVHLLDGAWDDQRIRKDVNSSTLIELINQLLAAGEHANYWSTFENIAGTHYESTEKPKECAFLNTFLGTVAAHLPHWFYGKAVQLKSRPTNSIPPIVLLDPGFFAFLGT
jgi:hypothetical protein